MLSRTFIQFSRRRAPPRGAVLFTTAAAAATALVAVSATAATKSTASTAAAGPATSHKRKVSIHAVRGPRPTMEDRWFVSDDLKFFAVYDGHGGFRVAEQAQRLMYDEFMKQLEEKFEEQEQSSTVSASSSSQPESSDEPKATSAEPHVMTPKEAKAAMERRYRFVEDPKHVSQALSRSFDMVSKRVLSSTYLDLEGSTAVVVCVCEDNIVTANLGDSRAILCRGSKAIPLTVDHKPDSATEKKRIEDLGGRVRWHGYLGPDRLPVPGMGAYRINGNLAVSRALGDRLERPYVSSEPDIVVHPMNKNEDRFVVLASDGLWDVMTSQDVVDFVKQIMSMGTSASASAASPPSARSRMTAVVPSFLSSSSKTDVIRNEIDKRQENMAQFLVEEALRRGSADNITAIVVWLR